MKNIVTCVWIQFLKKKRYHMPVDTRTASIAVITTDAMING